MGFDHDPEPDSDEVLFRAWPPRRDLISELVQEEPLNCWE